MAKKRKNSKVPGMYCHEYAKELEDSGYKFGADPFAPAEYRKKKKRGNRS